MGHEYVSLLTVAPALATGLSREQLSEAQRLAIAPLVTLPAGHWVDPELIGTLDDCERFGCVVADGLIARGVTLDGRDGTYLLGPGDLLAPSARPCRRLPAVRHYTAADPTRLALLDHTFLAIARRWPTISGALLAHAERQGERIALQNVIGHLPWAEQRIVALLWQLADRWIASESLDLLEPARRPTPTRDIRLLGERRAHEPPGQLAGSRSGRRNPSGQ